MSDIENPSAVYLAGRREWNERYGSYISRARQWRAMAFVLAGTTAVSTGFAVWRSAQSTVVPYIVAVDHLSDARPIGPVPAAPPVDAGRIKAQLARWIIDLRSVYTDPTAELTIVTEAMGWVDRSSDAIGQVTEWLRLTSPNERAKKETVGVAIESIGQIGADTWQCDWNEEHRTKEGNGPLINYWRATIRIKVDPPSDEATIMTNPNGVYVTWFKVTPRTR